MKGQAVNIEQLTKAINELRLSSKNKTFTRSEIYDTLVSIGFNKAIANYALALLYSEKLGKAKLYSFNSDPIHKSQVENLFKRYRLSKNQYNFKARHKSEDPVSSEVNEEAMIKYLKARGYQIRKPVGFDLQKFSELNPELYRKFIKYETL